MNLMDGHAILVSFSMFDELTISLLTASQSIVNLSFDSKINFGRTFSISFAMHVGGDGMDL